MDMSVFRMVSVGYAAENLEMGKSVLEVYPAELFPMADGEITADRSFLDVASLDADGIHFTAGVSYGNTIRAKWLPFGGNLITPPNLRRGMRVELWQVSDDSEEYYWRYMGLDNGLKRLETVIFAFSNTRDETVADLTPENSWYVEISTHTKTFTLQTNKSDGEKFAYTFQIDAAGHRATLADDAGQQVYLNSDNEHIRMENASGSYIEIEQQNAAIKVPDTIDMEAETVNLKCKTWNVTADTANFNIKQWKADGQQFTMTHQAQMMNIVNVLSLLTASGGLAAIPGGGGVGASSPSMSVGVPMEINAPSTFNGPVITNSVLINMGKIVGAPHTHITTAPGDPTSPVV